jgi:hypothetical protein
VKIRIIDKATGTNEDVSGVIPDLFETLAPFERKSFGFFVQKVPVKWEWNIIGAKGYSKP